jgi:PAS domain S-box-containing protein
MCGFAECRIPEEVLVGFSKVGHDITKRKKAEEVLRASLERLRLAQAAAGMGTFEWNIRTGVSIWTPELEAIYGLPTGGFGGTQAAFEDLVHPDDRRRATGLIEEALKTGEPTKGEWRVIWPDGTVHWIAGRAQAFVDESGEPSRVVGVNVDITERKVTENKLREYERAVEGSEEMIVVVDREYRYLIANRQFLKRYRKTREQVIGHFVYELAKKEAFEGVFKPKLDECLQGRVVRFELKYTYPDLGERDLSISYFPVEGPNGIDRAACVLQDVTDRKQAEKAVSEMTRKLIRAEEEQRTRIARELHDDINQRLALLTIKLEELQDEPSGVRSRVRELRKQADEISSAVQALSHELHSSKLEYLGVATAMKSWCRELAERHQIKVEFKSDVSSVLSPEIGLTLFRVLQEALRNAVKHSGAKQIEVQLAKQPNEVHLIVSDSGKGLDVEAAMQGQGLGLTSMRERVRLVNGTISIQSKPMRGTTIHVCVPFQADVTHGQLVKPEHSIIGLLPALKEHS